MTIKAELSPPSGPQARKLAAWVTLAVSAPRIFPGDVLPVSPLRFFEPHVYGVVMLILGGMLLATKNEPRRSSLLGRIVSAMAMTMWIVLAAATTSPTSMLVNVIFAAVMFMEIFADRWS